MREASSMVESLSLIESLVRAILFVSRLFVGFGVWVLGWVATTAAAETWCVHLMDTTRAARASRERYMYACCTSKSRCYENLRITKTWWLLIDKGSRMAIFLAVECVVQHLDGRRCCLELLAVVLS